MPLKLLVAGLPAVLLSLLAGHHINDRCAGKNQDIVNTGNYVYPIAVGNTKPLLRNLGHSATPIMNLIFVIQDIALRIKSITARYMYIEALAKRSNQGFFHGG